MAVVGQHVGDFLFFHNDEAGQIGKRDVRFVMVAQPQLPGFGKALAGDPLDDQIATCSRAGGKAG